MQAQSRYYNDSWAHVLAPLAWLAGAGSGAYLVWLSQQAPGASGTGPTSADPFSGFSSKGRWDAGSSGSGSGSGGGGSGSGSGSDTDGAFMALGALLLLFAVAG